MVFEIWKGVENACCLCSPSCWRLRWQVPLKWLPPHRVVYHYNTYNYISGLIILYIVEEYFWDVFHMCCVWLVFGSDHEIFFLQATGRRATSTKCTSISDIWWFERGHNSCCAGIKHTITKHICQQIKIFFQWQVINSVSWKEMPVF